MKSDGAIKTDVYRYIKQSEFMKLVNGQLSKTKRPHNSHTEDVVISILANEGTQQQKAVVNVNIYIQDIDVGGQFEEKTMRVDEICEKAWNLLKKFSTDEYNAHATEQRVYATDSGEHVINNQVEYKLIND